MVFRACKVPGKVHLTLICPIICFEFEYNYLIQIIILLDRIMGGEKRTAKGDIAIVDCLMN